MMIDSKPASLIGKYSVILAICYALEIAFSLWLTTLSDIQLSEENQYLMYLKFYSYGLTLLLNSIIALLLYSDIKNLKLSAPYVIIATLLFRPVGVFAFLIYALLATRETSKPEPIDGIIDR